METLQVTKTDRLLVKYAALPIMDTSVRFLVQVVEPLVCVPEVVPVTLASAGVEAPLDVLKRTVIAKWQAITAHALQEESIAWLATIESAEMVECDLLVPKSKA